MIWAGQGKTFIMLLMCLYLKKIDIDATITIVTCSKTLEKQMRQDFLLVSKGNLEYISFANKAEIGEINKRHYFLVDEADITTANPISFDDDGDLNGLYHLMHAKYCFFFGSTLNQ